MAKFSLVEGFDSFSTEVQEVSESIILEAEKVYETDAPAVIAALRASTAFVVEHAEPESDVKA